MARRRGRRKGRGHKRGAFPILLALPVIAPAIGTVQQVANKTLTLTGVPDNFIWRLTGYSIQNGGPINTGMATKTIGLAIGGLIGHKLASKLGVNRHMKKLTMGYFQL